MPSRPVPGRFGYTILTRIVEDHEGAEEANADAEHKFIAVDLGDTEELDNVPEIPQHQIGAFGVTREDTSRYGMSSNCRGCNAIGSGWRRSMAHPDQCRSRIMKEILEEGDPDERVANATRKEIEEDTVQGGPESIVKEKESIKR